MFMPQNLKMIAALDKKREQLRNLVEEGGSSPRNSLEQSELRDEPALGTNDGVSGRVIRKRKGKRKQSMRNSGKRGSRR